MAVCPRPIVTPRRQGRAHGRVPLHNRGPVCDDAAMPVVVKKLPLDYQTPPPARSSGWVDDLAYLAPMGTFLLFTQAGVTWRHLYPLTYVAKTVVVAVLLVLFRRRYTPVRWNFWWLG